MNLHVTYGGFVTDRVQDLYYGDVKADGIDLHFISAGVEEIFHRMTFNREFDASEMSFSTYIARVARDESPFIAIPVFPSRIFRHSAIYLSQQAGISEPKDLIGKRVGVPEYQMTAALWVRGLLLHEYGVKPEQIGEWVTGGLDTPGRRQMVQTNIPNVKITREMNKALNDMLAEGEIDALISARQPQAFEAGHPNITRMFPNYDEVEREYYHKHKLFPLMHTVVLRKDFYEKYPWTAISLYKAFEKSKDNCIHRMLEPRLSELPITLPWVAKEINRTLETFGNDFWPYGLEKNWNELDAMCQYSYEQGISPRRVDPEELFAPNVLSMSLTSKI
jgi:4,5-dihydroxyphthalate decarboxylase